MNYVRRSSYALVIALSCVAGLRADVAQIVAPFTNFADDCLSSLDVKHADFASDWTNVTDQLVDAINAVEFNVFNAIDNEELTGDVTIANIKKAVKAKAQAITKLLNSSARKKVYEMTFGQFNNEVDIIASLSQAERDDIETSEQLQAKLNEPKPSMLSKVTAYVPTFGLFKKSAPVGNNGGAVNNAFAAINQALANLDATQADKVAALQGLRAQAEEVNRLVQVDGYDADAQRANLVAVVQTIIAKFNEVFANAQAAVDFMDTQAKAASVRARVGAVRLNLVTRQNVSTALSNANQNLLNDFAPLLNQIYGEADARAN